MKAFFIDTVASVVFFTVVAGLTEFFIAGMAPDEVLTARLITIPVMILTGRPYGLWRDVIFTRFSPRSRPMTALTDICAFLTFQVPVYATTLLIAGASFAEIQIAISAAIVFMILLSRPFGLFLELARKWAAPAAT
ncbi:L-alanine exporter AlaE [Oceanibium sediminis]|uniref:L-alanine exporter AlaE n=1 Tax=Oceanibium sediminis TaxID=2026339 RepID=UPI000DD49539|nr:L-alanine exporter AlaE [Oceanibium sediminis]